MNSNTHTASAPETANTAEVTLGPDPQELIQKAIDKVSSAPLRSFLSCYFEQPEIHAYLSTPVEVLNARKPGGLCRYGVQVLRAAAETAAYSSEYGGAERQALYAATFLEASRSFLSASLEMGSNVDDVLHTLAHEPLRRLDRQDERMAGLVRMCMDWGLPDEVDEFYVPRLRNSVLRALRTCPALHAQAAIATASSASAAGRSHDGFLGRVFASQSGN